jgi:hypothetical protein
VTSWTQDAISRARTVELLTGLGQFFAVDLHDPPAQPTGRWRPLAEVVSRPDVVRARTQSARAVLAELSGQPVEAVEPRVAASTVHLALAARLVSPLLALAALGRANPIPPLGQLWWQDQVGGAVPLSLPQSALDARPDGDPVSWADDLLTGPLHELSAAFAALVPSPHVRAGNLASAIHGAVTVLGADPSRFPAHGVQRARLLAEVLLGHPVLRSEAVGEPGTGGFRRRSCCLIYRAGGRVAAHAVCGDCVLLDR